MKVLWWIGLLACASAAGQTVRIRQASGDIADLPLERYVAGVLAGESSAFQSVEALKAMAVAVRTYAVRMRGRHAAEGYDFCTTTHCQHFEMAPVNPRLEKAAADTVGELLWYSGKPAFTPYTRDCGGQSENAAAVWPDMAASYLKVHEDPYCLRSGQSQWQWSGDPRQIAEALVRSSLRSPRAVEHVSIVERTPSGRAQTLALAGQGGTVRISASSFRFAVGRVIGWSTIRSDFYEVGDSGGRVVFQGRGSGHGIGLCQKGADRMGSEGRTYHDILAFYYPGTQVGKNAQEILWQRLTGDTITILTMNPAQDGPVVALAERALRVVVNRTGWRPPEHLEVYLYPDIERFRDATGEPGWVAAHTSGTRVRLQPVTILQSRGVLEQTLRHEFLHVLVEAQARPDLPVWFREGIVEYLAGPPSGNPPAHFPDDADLRQTSDPSRARRAYEDSARAVADLTRRYGEATVLDWVRRGVPREVMNTSKSHEPMKSK